MATIDKQVKDLHKLETSLRGIRFTVSKRKDGTVKIKIGKKIDLLTVPSREWGDCIVTELDAVINRQANFIAEAMVHVKNSVEQLQLDLFRGDKNGSEGRIQQGGEQPENTAGNGDYGTECQTYDSTGDAGGAGKQPIT
jgi:hypothetical protein